MSSIALLPPASLVRAYPLASPLDADADELAKFEREIHEHIEDLAKSVEVSKGVAAEAAKYETRNGWKVLWGVFSGSNDKNLASMVEKLGGGLSTTQKVLELLLRLQTRKTNLLRRFHAALVEKIAALAGDAVTLDENQQDQNFLARMILSDLRDHVAEQVEHHERVLRHDQMLDELQLRVKRSEEVEASFSVQLDATERRALALTSDASRLRDDVTQLRKSLMERDAQWDREVNRLQADLARLESSSQKKLDELSETVARQQRDLQAIAATVDCLERERLAGTTAAAWLRRNWVSLAALVIAIGAAVR